MAAPARKKTTFLNPIDELRAMLDLSDVELAYLLEATPRTLYRWTERAPEEEYPPLKRLRELVQLAKQSLKESALAEWFHEPNRALGGSVPIRLAADPRGYQIVHDLLGNAAHGLPL
jgi:putative toxin-antitoxin system antitoxin component (TIGR02293 family)